MTWRVFLDSVSLLPLLLLLMLLPLPFLERLDEGDFLKNSFWLLNLFLDCCFFLFSFVDVHRLAASCKGNSPMGRGGFIIGEGLFALLLLFTLGREDLPGEEEEAEEDNKDDEDGSFCSSFFSLKLG